MPPFNTIRKTLVALAGAAVVIIGHFCGADSDAYFVAVTLLTAVGVYAVPNATSSPVVPVAEQQHP